MVSKRLSWPGCDFLSLFPEKKSLPAALPPQQAGKVHVTGKVGREEG